MPSVRQLKEYCSSALSKAGLEPLKFFALKRHESLLRLLEKAEGLGEPEDSLFAARINAMNGNYDKAEELYQLYLAARPQATKNYARSPKAIPDFLIQLTSKCDLSCSYCPRKTGGEETHMDPAVFEKILRQMADSSFQVRNITLNQSGESILNPDFFRMLEILEKALPKLSRRPSVLLFTNGQRFDKELSGRILGTNLVDSFIWSIDGVDSHSYERIRKGSSYDRTLRNFSSFLDIRRTGVKTTVYNMLDCECDLSKLDPALNAIFKKADSVAVRFPSARGKHNYGYYKYGPFRNKKACCWSQNQVVIDSRGKACLCSIDLKGETAFADLKDNSLREVCFERLPRLLSDMDEGRQNAKFDLCRNCPMTDNSYEPTFGEPLGEKALAFYASNIEALSEDQDDFESRFASLGPGLKAN